MKRFLLKVLFSVALYLAVSFTISIFTPYHWGNPWFSTKIKYLEEINENNYNVFFFGSSLVYRQINSRVFDDYINNSNQIVSNSFNLGAPATYTPQSYYLLRNFLNSEISNNLEYCFVELREIDLLGDYFLHQERSTYWQNFDDLKFVFKSLNSNIRLGMLTKIHSYRNYLISYFENTFRLGHFGKQMLNSDYYNKKYIGENGFLPLETHLQITDDISIKERLIQRQNSILEDSELIPTRISQIKNELNSKRNYYDEIHLEAIRSMLKDSEQKGIHLIFVVSPRNNITMELINLSDKIPREHLIDMSNPDKYPSLYEFENSFDVAHLNNKGSEIYSKLLAREFETILANN